MTPQELKNSILQLAVQGKLVPQLPEEGTAEELIKHITINNNVDGRKVKEKTITNISNDAMPFSIPDSWEWVKLGTVCTIARGGSPRPIKDYLTSDVDGVNWIKIGDTEKNGKYISSTKEKIKPSGVSKSRMVHKGDFLLTNSMSFGRPYILNIDGCIHDGWLVISQSSEVFFQDYLYWVLSSAYAYFQFCGKVSGAVVKNLNSDKVANSIFPLPPLAEQKRIVAKIEELLPYIDRYEKAWSKLEDFNKRFPGDMQKSVLQMAIQGKLVEQRPEGGTGEELYRQIQTEKQRLIKEGKIKKEKPLPEITEDEIPFEIPESWKWVRIGEISVVKSSKRVFEKDYVSSGIPFYRSKEIGDLSRNESIKTELFISEKHYSLLEREYGVPEKGDILITSVGTIGNTWICDGHKFYYKDGNITQISKSRYFDEKYIEYCIHSPIFEKQALSTISGTAYSALTIIKLKNIIIPLPPLAEQKRIVEKLEEILPLCEKLK